MVKQIPPQWSAVSNAGSMNTAASWRKCRSPQRLWVAESKPSNLCLKTAECYARILESLMEFILWAKLYDVFLHWTISKGSRDVLFVLDMFLVSSCHSLVVWWVNRGLGLRAIKDVEAEEVAVSIPLDLILTVSTALRSNIGRTWHLFTSSRKEHGDLVSLIAFCLKVRWEIRW